MRIYCRKTACGLYHHAYSTPKDGFRFVPLWVWRPVSPLCQFLATATYPAFGAGLRFFRIFPYCKIRFSPSGCVSWVFQGERSCDFSANDFTGNTFSCTLIPVFHEKPPFAGLSGKRGLSKAAFFDSFMFFLIRFLHPYFAGYTP